MLFASNKLYNNSYNLEIKDVMNSWIRLNYCPVLKVTQHGLFHVKLSIENALDQMVGIPVTFTTENYSNFNKTYRNSNIWSDMNNILLRLNLSSWIIINIQQTGKYNNKTYFLNFFSGYFPGTIEFRKSPKKQFKFTNSK